MTDSPRTSPADHSTSREPLAPRPDGRQPNELRDVSFERDFTETTPGSVLASFGRTRVLCTASLDEDVPRWLKGSGRGWVTSEYSMLPGSSPERIRREASTGRPSGRTQEIQRLIGRSLRSVCDLVMLADHQLIVDCDVLQADGGTRTAAICGGYLALHDALTRMVGAGLLAELPLNETCAAVSVGIVDGRPMVDLAYQEDVSAEVDMNVVMTGSGRFVELQGTAEGLTFTRGELDELLELAESGITEIMSLQQQLVTSPPSPWRFARA